MLSLTGDRGSGFLQEGSFSESLQNRTERHELGVFKGQGPEAWLPGKDTPAEAE